MTQSREQIIELLKKLILQANVELRDDVLNALKQAFEIEENSNGKRALGMLIENAEIAKRKQLPLCQDTGYVDIYFKGNLENVILSVSEESRDPSALPQDDKSLLILQRIVDEVVSKVYREKSYRSSIVADPLFERKNTGDNTPANVFIIPSRAENLEISVMIKGAGSDNSSAVFMLNPSTSKEDIVDLVVKHIKENGAKSCPPLIVGIGIGSSFDKVAALSKKALLKPIIGQQSTVNGQRDEGKTNLQNKYALLAQEILVKINKLGIGASGLGGQTTALAVNIEQASCHMASLPVAINLNCYALRTASEVIGGK